MTCACLWECINFYELIQLSRPYDISLQASLKHKGDVIPYRVSMKPYRGSNALSTCLFILESQVLTRTTLYHT